jgi:hypothetical protein
MPAKSYAQVVNQSRQAIASARLNDPNEHFPYKRQDVDDLLNRVTPMGPGSPNGDTGEADTSRTIVDYISADIANATGQYIDAQAAYLEDPSEDTKDEYDAARDRLQAARLDHRASRGDGFTVGAAARRAG